MIAFCHITERRQRRYALIAASSCAVRRSSCSIRPKKDREGAVVGRMCKRRRVPPLYFLTFTKGSIHPWIDLPQGEE